MAGTFGGALSDRITHRITPEQANRHPVTFWAWVFATTLTNGRKILSFSATETTADGSGFRNFGVRSTGQLTFDTDWTTTNVASRSANSAGSIIGLNDWWFVAGGVNAAGVPKLYLGQRGVLVTEVAAYLTQTTGAGLPYTDAGGWIKVGNDATNDVAWQGRIAWAGMETLEPSMSWLIPRQREPWRVFSSTRFLSRPFQFGPGTQPDLSGNGAPGVVTGATVGLDMPEAVVRERKRPRILSLALTVPAAGGFVPFPRPRGEFGGMHTLGGGVNR